MIFIMHQCHIKFLVYYSIILWESNRTAVPWSVVSIEHIIFYYREDYVLVYIAIATKQLIANSLVEKNSKCHS